MWKTWSCNVIGLFFFLPLLPHIVEILMWVTHRGKEWTFRDFNRWNSVSQSMGVVATHVCQPMTKWMIPGHNTAPLSLPRWYFSTAKCHINIHHWLINLSSHGTCWHLISCSNTDGTVAGPLHFKYTCSGHLYHALQTLRNLVHPSVFVFFLFCFLSYTGLQWEKYY